MKKTLGAVLAASMLIGPAYADGHGERYVMITHTQGTDPFWPVVEKGGRDAACLLYTSPSPRDRTRSRMPSSA